MRLSIVPIMALLCIPSWVRADEIPQGYTLSQDGSKIVRADEPRTQLMRTRANGCPPQFANFTAEQCRRLRIQNNKMAQRRRNDNVRVIREKVYVVDRDRDRRGRDDYDYRASERSGGQCISEPYTMEGTKNLAKFWAEYNAREAWRRKVRSKHGTQFQDTSRARGTRTKCWPEGAFTRCEFTGRACRA